MSKKATFSTQQEKVNIRYSQDLVYIFICLNEEAVLVADSADENGDSSFDNHIEYEYDYNEIICKKDEIDLEELQAHPEIYLD
jgi:hypothetical protein